LRHGRIARGYRILGDDKRDAVVAAAIPERLILPRQKNAVRHQLDNSPREMLARFHKNLCQLGMEQGFTPEDFDAAYVTLKELGHPGKIARDTLHRHESLPRYGREMIAALAA
jgi:hypothetical protein